MFSLLLLVWSAHAVLDGASHLFPVFRDLHGLKQQARAKPSARHLAQATEQHEFTHEAEDTNIHLAYNALHHEQHTLALLDAETAPDIVEIKCTDSVVTVSCTSSETAQTLLDRAVLGDFMSGACVQLDQHTEPRPIYGQIESAQLSSLDNQVLILEISRLNFQDLFEEIDITFKWSPPHRDPISPSFTRTELQQAQEMNPPPSRGRKLLYLDRIGDFANDLGESITDWADDLVDRTQDLWSSVSAAVKDAMSGDDAQIEESFNVVNINYDKKNARAENRSMPFFHAPWLVCTDCFAHLELYVDSHIAFQATGLPKLFDVEVGGDFDAKIYVEADAIHFPVANEMGNWHNLVPRTHIATFTFYVGSVPVVVSVDVELNGGLEVDKAVDDVELSAGAQLTAHASARAEWNWDDSWSYDVSHGWDVNYWLPRWDFDPNDADVNLQALVSPTVIVTFWQTIPFVMKPKPYVNVAMGSVAKLVQPDSLTCARAEEAYATTYGIDMGLGIEDIAVPESVPVLGGVTLVSGVDFGLLQVLPAAAIEGCGPLCSGCLSDYRANKAEYEAIALKNLGLEQSSGVSAGTVLGWLFFVTLVVAFGVWVVKYDGKDKLQDWYANFDARSVMQQTRAQMEQWMEQCRGASVASVASVASAGDASLSGALLAHDTEEARGEAPAQTTAPQPQLPKKLPAGWEQHTTEDGHHYYWNAHTDESTWECPA